MSLQSFRELNIKHIFLTDEIWNFSTKENVQESKGDFFFEGKGTKIGKKKTTEKRRITVPKVSNIFGSPYVT